MESRMPNIYFSVGFGLNKYIKHTHYLETKSTLQGGNIKGVIITTYLHLQDATKYRTYHWLNDQGGGKKFYNKGTYPFSNAFHCKKCGTMKLIYVGIKEKRN